MSVNGYILFRKIARFRKNSFIYSDLFFLLSPNHEEKD